MKKKKSGEKELKSYGSMSLDVKDNKEDCCEEQTDVSYVTLSPPKRQIFTIYPLIHSSLTLHYYSHYSLTLYYSHSSQR